MFRFLQGIFGSPIKQQSPTYNSHRIFGAQIVPAVPEVMVIGHATDMVPLQPIAELLGATLLQDPDGDFAFTLGTNTLTVSDGTFRARLNGKDITIKHAPFISFDALFVPLKSLVSTCRLKVIDDRREWITIRDPVSGITLQMIRTYWPDIPQNYPGPVWEQFVVNMDGSGLRRLTYAVEGTLQPSLSPDGKRLLYGCGVTDVAEVIRDLHHPDVVFLEPLYEQSISVSTTHHIDFSPANPNELIHLMIAETGDTLVVTHRLQDLGAHLPLREAFITANDRYLAMDCSEGIYLVDCLAKTARLIGDGIGSRLSADGSKLLIEQTDFDEVKEIFYSWLNVYELADGQVAATHLVTNPDADNTESNGNFSPDGKTIVYTHMNRNEDSSIWVMDAARENRRPLTEGKDDEYPQYTPDGRSILFTREHDLHIMNTDGSEIRRLTQGLRVCGFSIFPDGRQVLLLLRLQPVDQFTLAG